MSHISIRVYGLLINEHRQVLLSDEFIRGQYYTKFPGGGLEFGEGLREGLKREFQEELQLNVEVADHIYTTDFYQQSAFNPNHQILSVYYHVHPLEPIRVALRKKAFGCELPDQPWFRNSSTVLWCCLSPFTSAPG